MNPSTSKENYISLTEEWSIWRTDINQKHAIIKHINCKEAKNGWSGRVSINNMNLENPILCVHCHKEVPDHIKKILLLGALNI